MLDNRELPVGARQSDVNGELALELLAQRISGVWISQ